MSRALLAAVLGLCACMLTPVQRREERLVREARMFNDDMRWNRWDAMAASLPRDEVPLFHGRVAAVGDNLVIADYEVTSITFASGSEAATVAARFDWYVKTDPTLRTTALEQRWELQGARWVMTKQRRLRGERLPLVTEPVPPPLPVPAPAAASPSPGK